MRPRRSKIVKFDNGRRGVNPFDLHSRIVGLTVDPYLGFSRLTAVRPFAKGRDDIKARSKAQTNNKPKSWNIIMVLTFQVKKMCILFMEIKVIMELFIIKEIFYKNYKPICVDIFCFKTFVLPKISLKQNSTIWGQIF